MFKTNMLEKLTKKQEASMPEFVEKWVKIVHQPTRDIDTVTKNIKWLYEQCGFDSTKVKVRVVDLDEYVEINKKLESQVWSQVRLQVRSQVWYRADELAFGDYFYSHGIIKDNKDIFYKFADVIQDAGMAIYLENECILLAKPKVTLNNGIPHNEEDKAIKWENGSGIYVLNGVTVDEELHKKVVSKNLSFKEVMALENIEHRMVAMQYIDPDVLIENTDSTLLDESKRGNRLYKVEDLFVQTAYFLRYDCPSSGRKYFSGVHPEVGKEGNADACMAWKFSLSEEAYQMLEPLKTES